MTPVFLKPVVAADLSRGLVRLAPGQMGALGLAPGETVAISGRRRTHARAIPGPVPEGEIHADESLSLNTGVQDGEEVALAPVGLGPLDSLRLRLPEGAAAGPENVRPEDLRDTLFDMPLTRGDRFRLTLPGALPAEAEVEAAMPEDAGHVTEKTAVTLAPYDVSPSSAYAGIGGLEDEIARLHEIVATPLLRPDLFRRLGLDPPRGVLLAGPPGSGKTLLARAVAENTRATFFHLAGPEIVTKHYGESEAALRRVFAAARRQAPAILFMDEIDAIAPRRDDLSAEKQVERRLVAQLLALLDGLDDRGQVVVLAATNLPDAIDPALRRPGRLEREIVIPPPGMRQRRDILEVHLARTPRAPDTDLDAIAQAAYGYVGADLAALAREAALAALARATRAAGGEAHVEASRLAVTQPDLEHALSVTAPSVLRGSGGPVDGVALSEIAGIDDVKARLLRAIEWTHAEADTVARFRVVPPRGILLTGPPGCGKTLLARAIAAHVGMNFVAVRATDLLTRHFGEAEQAVARLFAAARHSAPTLLFFDEFDALAGRRAAHDGASGRIVTQLLVEIDGIAGRDGIVLLAATNRPDALDPAITRPGRLDEVIEIPLPDTPARRAILEVHLSHRPLAPDVNIAALADATDGATGADLAAIAAAAARDAAAREIAQAGPDTISQRDLQDAVLAWQEGQGARRADFIATEGPSE